jgi:hypothetical protein
VVPHNEASLRTPTLKATHAYISCVAQGGESLFLRGKRVLSYKERSEKLRRPSDFGQLPALAYSRWYSYLINEWIPCQPDSGELMGVFIDCQMCPTDFVKRLVST